MVLYHVWTMVGRVGNMGVVGVWAVAQLGDVFGLREFLPGQCEPWSGRQVESELRFLMSQRMDQG